MRSTFPRSAVLALGLNTIQAVLPSTLISQVESLLDSHRIKDAVDLADAQWTKTQGNISVNSDEAEELYYVYQQIGFHCLNETLFAEAGKNLLRGDIDPRLLVRYFPNLRGSLFTADDIVPVFAGVAECMPTDDSVDDIIRNYSPHLAPDTRTAPPTMELRKILGDAAVEMLEEFLRRWRKVKIEPDKPMFGSSGVRSSSKETSTVVDTVLAKLYSEFGRTSELFTLLQEPNCIMLSEVEPVLLRKRQYPALCMLYKERGEDLKLLEAWSKLVDGEWMHEDIKDPLSDMIRLLNEKKDTALIRKWGVWLLKRDPERGLKLLILKDSGKRRERPEEDLELLEHIREANSAAGIQFLEYLVLQKRSTSREIHTQLAMSCVEQLFAVLNEDSVSKLWRAKVSSYMSNPSHVSFLSYFISTTPNSTHKHLRLKAILCLAGSTLYDPAVIYSQILLQQKILKLEMAIIQGMLGNHCSALAILAHDLHDYTTAEAYCMLGGAVVSAKTAQMIVESDAGLEQWVSVLFGAAPPTSKSVLHHNQMFDGELKRELLKTLLGVYMNNGKPNASQVANLLNSQAMNFDVLDVINLIPLHWPVNILSSFLNRSFEQILHEHCEGKIMKMINAGQNISIKEQTWHVLRQHGMIIEEAADDGIVERFEDYGFAEKLALQSGNGASNISDSKESKGEM